MEFVQFNEVIVMNIFGYVVKQYLLNNNLKQNDIANNSDMTKATVSKLLNRDNISLDKMLEIANALNCNLEINLVPKE